MKIFQPHPFNALIYLAIGTINISFLIYISTTTISHDMVKMVKMKIV